jgi:hypothetical protein
VNLYYPYFNLDVRQTFLKSCVSKLTAWHRDKSMDFLFSWGHSSIDRTSGCLPEGLGFDSPCPRLIRNSRIANFLFPSFYLTVLSWVKSIKPIKYWQTQEISGAIADPVNSDSDAERLNSCERKAYLLDTEVLSMLGKVLKIAH